MENKDQALLLSGVAIGVGLMFVLDPARGRRRRALVRDKARWASRKTRDAAGATRRDVRNRLAGVIAGARARFSGEDVDDRILAERVRAQLGRVCSHPRSIDVEAHLGTVTLRGHILAGEVDAVIAAVGRVRGVDTVENEMEAHEEAGSIPHLQGESARPDEWQTWATSGWSPTAQLMCGIATTAVGLLVARRVQAA